MKNTRGFTLIEILLVVAAIGILAGIVILAVNPNKQLGDTRNAQRRADVNTLLNGVYQYVIDNNGAVPSAITVTSTEICATTGAACLAPNPVTIDLGFLTLNQKYLASIPTEPNKTMATGAGYRISQSANGRITVVAQFPEQGATISVTR